MQLAALPQNALHLKISASAFCPNTSENRSKWIFATKGTKNTEDYQFALSPFVTFVPLVANAVMADFMGLTLNEIVSNHVQFASVPSVTPSFSSASTSCMSWSLLISRRMSWR